MEGRDGQQPAGPLRTPGAPVLTGRWDGGCDPLRSGLPGAAAGESSH